MSHHPDVWYRDKERLQIGGVRRFNVKYTPQDENTECIYLRIKNIERTSIRAIHLLNGPFILYCHAIPINYHHKQEFKETTREIHFNNLLKPGQTFNVKLLLNDNSRLRSSPDTYCWKIEIVSQIVISSGTTVLYDMMIGSDMESMKKVNHGPFRAFSSLGSNASTEEIELRRCFNPSLSIERVTEQDIWSKAPDYSKPVHLVIITHGIFSNLTADMAYLKESLEDNVNDNLLIKGFSGNAGKTEVGVKKMGTKQGKHIMSLINNLLTQNIKIDKISFIAHSLGGLTQLYSIKYILDCEADFFNKRSIRPHNLIFMASPLLGMLNEISFVFSWLLDLGTLGKTGRDLTLSRSNLKGRPVLEQLPDQVHEFMKQCKNLILYANILNDGIVPLRTSSLMFLDYATLDNVRDLEKEQQNEPKSEKTTTDVIKKKNPIHRYAKLVSLNMNIVGDKKKERLQKRLLQVNTKSIDSMKSSGTSLDDDDDTFQDHDSDSIEMNQDDAEKTDLESTQDEKEVNFHIPPKASVVQSAINTIICPIPNQKFIIDPESRRPVIFHDKYYPYENLPPIKEETNIFNKVNKQAKIARKYHNHLNWRKVLVRLPSDAHNNIIVRRRFPNGYGWGVVDHLCDVFNETNNNAMAGPTKADPIKSKM